MHNKSLVYRIASLSLCIVVALSLVAAALPQPAQAASQAASCAKTHVVKDGETIYRIARTYSVSVGRLAKANDLESPYHLTAGESLCIPNTASSSVNAKWTATFTNGQIKVTGTGFKKDRPFVVRVRENDTSAWYKLGSIETDDDGELSETVKVHKDLLKKPSLMVCLKDAVTDGLQCKQVFRQ
jgi:hypothetical protein